MSRVNCFLGFGSWGTAGSAAISATIVVASVFVGIANPICSGDLRMQDGRAIVVERDDKLDIAASVKVRSPVVGGLHAEPKGSISFTVVF